MSPTVASVLMLSLLLVVSLPAAEAGEIADLFALIRNTLKFWRRIYQTYEEEVALGYCWAEYLVRRGNATDLESIVPHENENSFGKQQWDHDQWVLAVQGHGRRGKRSYRRVSNTWSESSGDKDDIMYARKNSQVRAKHTAEFLSPWWKVNSRPSGIETKLNQGSTFNFAAWDDDDDLAVDFRRPDRRNSSCSCNEESASKVSCERRTGTMGGTTTNDQVREYERFLRNLAPRRGGRSTEIPCSTDIGEISKIAADALASSARPGGSNKTKLKLNELRPWPGSRDPLVDETKDTRDDYSRHVETPGLVSSPNVEKLSNSWKGKPSMDELRRVKVPSGERSIFPPIVADLISRLSSSGFFPADTRRPRELLFFRLFPVARPKKSAFDLEFRNVQLETGVTSRGKRDANDRIGRASFYNSVREVPKSSMKHGVEILSGGTMIRYSKLHRDYASSVKQEPVIDGVSKFRASSDRNYVIESLRSTKGDKDRERRAKNRRGRNNSKRSSLASIDNRLVGRDREHHVLSHFQQVFTAFLTALGFFVNVGRQLMDYVDSNSALACTKDYILGKAVHWIDS